jgi:hypothetical protein
MMAVPRISINILREINRRHEHRTFSLLRSRQVNQDPAREAAHNGTVNVLWPIGCANDNESRPPIRVCGVQAIHFLVTSDKDGGCGSVL